jgi:hypothetical protein
VYPGKIQGVRNFRSLLPDLRLGPGDEPFDIFAVADVDHAENEQREQDEGS